MLHVISMHVISWPQVKIYVGLIICEHSMNGHVGYVWIKGSNTSLIVTQILNCLPPTITIFIDQGYSNATQQPLFPKYYKHYIFTEQQAVILQYQMNQIYENMKAGFMSSITNFPFTTPRFLYPVQSVYTVWAVWGWYTSRKNPWVAQNTHQLLFHSMFFRVFTSRVQVHWKYRITVMVKLYFHLQLCLDRQLLLFNVAIKYMMI